MVFAPEAVLIAGANGAGKTTFAREFLHVRYPGASFLNADEIQREGGALSHPVAAGRELIRRLAGLVGEPEPCSATSGVVSRGLSHDDALHRATVRRLRRRPGGNAGCGWWAFDPRGGHSSTLSQRLGDVRVSLQADGGPVVSLAQRRPRTST